MWNICEIFSNNADKARLLTAVLSVVAAVLVVILTHALASKRNRSETKLKKLEKIFEAVRVYGKFGSRLMHEKADPGGQEQKSHGEFYQSYSQVVLLATIYETSILKDIEKMHDLVFFTKDDGSEDISRFPEKLEEYSALLLKIQNKVATKARKNV